MFVKRLGLFFALKAADTDCFLIKWDAGLDKGKQLFVDAELMYKNTDDVTGSLLVRSPLQNNKININRRSENTHFDIKSYGKEKATVDVYLKQTHEELSNPFIGVFRLIVP
jgi:hypothetical protein